MFVKGSSLSGNHNHGGRPGIKGGSASKNSSFSSSDARITLERQKLTTRYQDDEITKAEYFAEMAKLRTESDNNFLEWESHIKSKIKEANGSTKELSNLLFEIDSDSNNANLIRRIIKKEIDELSNNNDVYTKISNTSQDALPRVSDLEKIKQSYLSDSNISQEEKDLAIEAIDNEVEKSLNTVYASLKQDIDFLISDDTFSNAEKLAYLSDKKSNIVKKLGKYSGNCEKVIYDAYQGIKQQTIEGLKSRPDVLNSGTYSLDGYESNNAGQARGELDSIAGKQRNQVKAVGFYEYQGDGVVNGYLRDGEIAEEYTRESIQEKIDLMDSAMNDTLKANTLLVRWVGQGHPVIDALKQGKDIVGTVYNESAYSSTSMDNNYEGSKYNTKIIIKAPRGTRGLSFSSEYDLAYEDEYEFCLPRGATFKVLAVDNGVIIVDLIENGITP